MNAETVKLILDCSAKAVDRIQRAVNECGFSSDQQEEDEGNDDELKIEDLIACPIDKPLNPVVNLKCVQASHKRLEDELAQMLDLTAKANLEQSEQLRVALAKNQKFLQSFGRELPATKSNPPAAIDTAIIEQEEVSGEIGPSSSSPVPQPTEAPPQPTEAKKPPLPFQHVEGSNDEEKLEAARRRSRSAKKEAGGEDESYEEDERRRICYGIMDLDIFEFDFIPKYMKGRLNLAAINAYVAGFNDTMNGKYELMTKPFRTLSKKDKDRVIKWRDQDTPNTQGCSFCTEADIRAVMDSKSVAHHHKIIPILRHAKRIKENRERGLCRFIKL